jgi:hypothetical protein
MVLWERPSRMKEKSGYLYLRETIYIRDKRTLKKSRKNFDGTATKERGKYSKKKDIYCGKINNCEIKNFKEFTDYVKDNNKENKKFEFTDYKMNTSFTNILNDFVEYLIYVYEIDKDLLFSKKKKVVFQVGNGYLCQQTLEFIKKFEPRGDFDNEKEIERFANRCQDAGIFDTDIIMTLFLKLFPEDVERIKEDEEKYDKSTDQKVSAENLYGFIKGD